jgi:hypothetical protein
MKPAVVRNANKANRFFRLGGDIAFTALMTFLVGIVISSSMANIQTDSIDYYAVVQRFTQDSGDPIVRNLHFVDQRSLGYPILSGIPYHIISLLIEPFVHTEKIVTLSNPPDSPAQVLTERMLLPNEPIRFMDILFKNFYIEMQDSWIEWKIIFSMRWWLCYSVAIQPFTVW